MSSGDSQITSTSAITYPSSRTLYSGKVQLLADELPHADAFPEGRFGIVCSSRKECVDVTKSSG